MFSCWYEAHCWQCHDKNGLTSASPVSCGSTGAITPPLVTKLSLQTLLGELLGAPVNMPQSPTLTGSCHNICHWDSHRGLVSGRWGWGSRQVRGKWLSCQVGDTLQGGGGVSVRCCMKFLEEKPQKSRVNNWVFLSRWHHFKYYHNRQIFEENSRMQHECLGEGRYRSKYEIFLVEIIPTGVHKSFKKCTLTQNPIFKWVTTEGECGAVVHFDRFAFWVIKFHICL